MHRWSLVHILWGKVRTVETNLGRKGHFWGKFRKVRKVMRRNEENYEEIFEEKWREFWGKVWKQQWEKWENWGKVKQRIKKSGRVVKFKEECGENFNKVYIIYSILSNKFKNKN